MSIFNPSAPSPTPTPTPDQSPKVNQAERSPVTIEADSRREPLAHLLPHVEGHPWTVKAYYSQILMADDPAQAQQLTLSPVLQQYHKILNLEFRVSSPLSFEFNKERQVSRLQGTAYLYYGSIVPTRGDMFVADVGDGNLSIFSLNDVTPMSHMRERVYEVNYREVGFSDARLRDLETKTVKTSYFIRDYLLHGRDPILSERSLQLREILEQQGHQILETFTRKFVNPRYRYLLVPEQDEPTFDFLMARMLQRLLNLSQYPALRAANWPDVYEIRELGVTSIWDVMLQNQLINPATFGRHVLQRVGVASTWVVKHTSVFHNLFYSSIKQLVWPITEQTDVDTTSFQRAMDTETLRIHNLTAFVDEDDESVVEEPDESEEPDLPPPPAPTALYYSVTVDNCYVFSQAFYDGKTHQQSQLELMVTLMLTRQVLNPQVLEDLCVAWYDLQPLEQFYYAPVLLILIDYFIRGAS